MIPAPRKTSVVLAGLTVTFLALAAAFLTNLWGRTTPPAPIPLVDPQFTNTATVRTNLADLIRAKADLSDFDCYACHQKGKPPPLRYDPTNHNLIIPKEHEDIVMRHGRHDRNNNCFNCHNETNLVVLQTRDGRELKLEESPALCGSCHGPTYRDWEAGVHGRTSGHWDRQAGPFDRKLCVSCHNPHSPAFPSRHPAPGPHPLRPVPQEHASSERSL
jgi:uncharacterized CHY-type Zn-finger protein